MISLNGAAQTVKTEHMCLLTNIHVIVLQLWGNSSIQLSGNDEIKIKSYLLKKGNIWGWQLPVKRPNFLIKERISNDTVFINSPSEFRPKVIGIDTYSETIENTVLLPFDKKSIIRRADQLTIEDNLKSLEITNTNEILIDIRKEAIKELKCHTQRLLKVNGAKMLNEYELYGTGTNIYNLKADQIIINFK
jgi:hypothetical protein